MALPRIKTRVVHSESKHAWNVIGTELGSKYKIARVPYQVVVNSNELTEREKLEAYEHAIFISTCFNAAFDEQNYWGQKVPSIYNNINPEDLPF